MKLELGCGERPTEGYLHQDISNISGTVLDFNCQPYEISLPDDYLNEVIALGVMEHLTEEQFEKTVFHMINLLKKDGEFYFDVPDMKYWFKYAVDSMTGFETPFDRQHIENTILGWRRFPGDEHKSIWDEKKLRNTLTKIEMKFRKKREEMAFWTTIESSPELFKVLPVYRNRFSRWETDRHLYVRLIKN